MTPQAIHYRHKAVANIRHKLQILADELDREPNEIKRMDIRYRISKWEARLLCYSESLQGLDTALHSRYDGKPSQDPRVEIVSDELKRVEQIASIDDMRRELRGLIAYINKANNYAQVVANDEFNATGDLDVDGL